MADFDNISEGMILQLFDRVDYSRRHKDSNPLDSNEMIAMQLMWNNWVGGDAAARGFDSFILMFQHHPETQKLFDFARGHSAAQMQNSSRLLFHVTRVIHNITDVMDHLHELEEVVPTLRQLGGRHGQNAGCYHVPGSYFPWLGDAMKELMGKKGGWTDSHTKAWAFVWNFICSNLTSGQDMYGGGSTCPAKKA